MLKAAGPGEQVVSQWAVKALSRQLLRFSKAGMQIRGKHTIVRVNGTEIVSRTRANCNNDGGDDKNIHSVGNQSRKEDGWSIIPVTINAGDIISLQPRGGPGLLEFGVVNLNQGTANEKGSVIPKCSVKDDSVDTLKPNTNKDDVNKSQLLVESQSGQRRKTRVVSSKLAGLDDDDEEGSVIGAKTKSPSRNSPSKPTQAPFLVYFFPFGNGTFTYGNPLMSIFNPEFRSVRMSVNTSSWKNIR